MLSIVFPALSMLTITVNAMLVSTCMILSPTDLRQRACDYSKDREHHQVYGYRSSFECMLKLRQTSTRNWMNWTEKNSFD
jgi:hypothetical protein